MNKAAVYIRTSREDQDPELQREECVKFAKNRGYEVYEVFKEQLSAWKNKTERPKYEKIKQLAHKGEIDAVVVWALDRWVRDREDLIQDVTYLTQRGVKLHSVQEDWLESINIEGPLGDSIREFLLGLMGAMAEIESNKISERTKRGLEKARERGEELGRPSADFNQRRAYYLLFEEEESQRKVAEEVGVSAATINRYKKAWEEDPPSFIKGLDGKHSLDNETKGGSGA